MEGALRVADSAMYNKNFLALSSFTLELAFTLTYISPSLDKQRGAGLPMEVN